MQDGSGSTSKGLYLCTYGFTLADIQRLIQYLSYKYNNKCSIHKSVNKNRIYVLVKSVNTLKDLILPFMHQSMTYKLGI